MTKRILVLDGGIGTYLQKLQLKEEDFQGETFLHHHVPLKGCNDVLCISNPQVVIDMHRNYIKAGHHRDQLLQLQSLLPFRLRTRRQGL